MRTYPRLDDSPMLRELVSRLMHAPIAECRTLRASWHPSAWHEPTGGEQATAHDLQQLAADVTGIAETHGYPEDRNTRGFDIAMSVLLYERLGITPVEATAAGIWNFLSCVLVPDVVAWRFPTRTDHPDGGNVDRWIVDRRSYRHAFGRLWWRACMLRDPDHDDAFYLLRQLQEDEFIQIMERPHLAGYGPVVRQLITTMLVVFGRRPHLNRGTLMRAAAKRLLRLGAVLDLHALDEPGMKTLIDEIVETAVMGVEGVHAASARA